MENFWQRPLQNESLAKQVYQKLKDAIFSGELTPGQPVREMHVARSMQVSQATVREALVQLQQTGLVIREPNRRTVVTAFSPDEVANRISVRLTLEQLAAVEASKRMNHAELTELAALANEIDNKLTNQDSLDALRSDIAFHNFIWNNSGNPILAKTLESLTTPLFALTCALLRAGLVDTSIQRPHGRLQEAIAAKDADRIHQELAAQIEATYRGFFSTGLGVVSTPARAAIN